MGKGGGWWMGPGVGGAEKGRDRVEGIWGELLFFLRRGGKRGNKGPNTKKTFPALLLCYYMLL